VRLAQAARHSRGDGASGVAALDVRRYPSRSDSTVQLRTSSAATLSGVHMFTIRLWHIVHCQSASAFMPWVERQRRRSAQGSRRNRMSTASSFRTDATHQRNCHAYYWGFFSQDAGQFWDFFARSREERQTPPAPSGSSALLVKPAYMGSVTTSPWATRRSPRANERWPGVPTL